MFEDFKKFLGSPRACVVCGADPDASTRELWAKDEYFVALRCQNCDMIAIEPGLSEEGLNHFYSNYIQRRFDNEDKMLKRRIQYDQDLEFLEQHITSGRILDVGCNGGFFLDVFGDKYEKYGIEIDPDAVKHARENLGLDVRHEEFGKDSFEDNSFDVVIFRGVIEHLYQPKPAVERAWQVLKPGGLLYFAATPNADCFSADFYREKWNVWHPIEHINIFSVKTLHSLVGQNKFDFIASDYPYLGTPYENQSSDYARVQADVLRKERGEWDQVSKSPAFWGNMMSVIFSKSI